MVWLSLVVCAFYYLSGLLRWQHALQTTPCLCMSSIAYLVHWRIILHGDIDRGAPHKDLPLCVGESTTMALIAERWGLIPELKSWAKGGRPIWGTCAGLIFLADRASGLTALLPLPSSLLRLGAPWTSSPFTAHATHVPKRQCSALMHVSCHACRTKGGRSGVAGRPGLQSAAQLLWCPDQFV